MTSTNALTEALHRDTTALEAYQASTWTPHTAERELSGSLARAHWDPHILRTALRDIPPAVRAGQLIDILAPAADTASQADSPHHVVPQLRALIDTLAT